MAQRALTPQQEAELAFWRDLVNGVGPKQYHAFRAAEYADKTRHFPSFATQDGEGLDYGCGCVSVFEGAQRLQPIIAVDPLWSYYESLLPPTKLRCSYLNVAQDEPLVFVDFFDWVACINMIDHTPDPQFALEQIWKVLRPGGRLYFEVNFEAGIAPPHYGVWNEGTITSAFADRKFHVEHMTVENVPQHNQRRCWVEFVKV